MFPDEEDIKVLEWYDFNPDQPFIGMFEDDTSTPHFEPAKVKTDNSYG